MAYKIAGIDVHKKMLHVVFSDVEVDGEYQFERRRFDTSPSQLRLLAEWLLEQQVEEVAMESTAQSGNPSGECWNATGNRSARSEKVLARHRERYIWRRHCRIAGGVGAREISATPNVW